MTDVLLSGRHDAVLTLTINRPDALNALNRETTRALTTAFEAAARDPEVGAIIVTGAGRAFCAGADLREVAARAQGRETAPREAPSCQYAPVIRALRACPQPVVPALNGTAAGAGLGVALAR